MEGQAKNYIAQQKFGAPSPNKIKLSSSIISISVTALSDAIAELGLELAIDPPPPQGGILYTMIF